MKKIFRYIYYSLYLVVFYINKYLSKILFLFIKRPYLFIERGLDAQDNAYYMYCYYVSKGYKCRYIISKDSKDINKIDKKDIIYFKSLKHFFMINLARAIISTHIGTYLTIFTLRINLFKPNGKVIFLQHGIMHNTYYSLTYKKTRVDLFISGAKREYLDLISPKYGYPLDHVCYSGLARYDNLYPHIRNDIKPIKKILIMITWRSWINKYNFANSLFYLKWISFITNKKLNEFLKANNICLSIALHHGAKDFFKKENFEPYKLALSLSEEIVSSDMLITDYSSIFFDFGFMKKPVIYYQFDEDEFVLKQYSKGYFSYKDDGFGPVINNEDKLIDTIISIVNGSYDMSQYRKREEAFFERRDDNNRKRNYEAIEKCLKE